MRRCFCCRRGRGAILNVIIDRHGSHPAGNLDDTQSHGLLLPSNELLLIGFESIAVVVKTLVKQIPDTCVFIARTCCLF